MKISPLRFSSPISTSGRGSLPSYCTTEYGGSNCASIIPTPPRCMRGKKGKAKCSEAAEVYKGATRERGFAGASQGGPSGTIDGAGQAHPTWPHCRLLQTFSTTDLLNWQRHTPPYSEKVQGTIHLIETILGPTIQCGDMSPALRHQLAAYFIVTWISSCLRNIKLHVFPDIKIPARPCQSQVCIV